MKVFLTDEPDCRVKGIHFKESATLEKYQEKRSVKQAPAIIPEKLKGKKLTGIVQGERVDKAHNLTPENFTLIRFVRESVNVKKKDKVFYHAAGFLNGVEYFLIFE